uniref:Uncharacterized protein n=1 Tax=Anguilla anguilla TaxID=7936 RepID=A0A0E9TZC7_ANGAN
MSRLGRCFLSFQQLAISSNKIDSSGCHGKVYSSMPSNPSEREMHFPPFAMS